MQVGSQATQRRVLLEEGVPDCGRGDLCIGGGGGVSDFQSWYGAREGHVDRLSVENSGGAGAPSARKRIDE